MAARNRLTNNSDETLLEGLLAGDVVYSIPYFQRPYKWAPERIGQLQTDILNLVDEETDFHFLGAAILHGKKSNPSDPRVFDVIDGQQRITTLILFLCAIVKILWEKGQQDNSYGLFLKFLVIPRDTSLISNYKIHSCKDDRNQINWVYSDILNEAGFQEKLGSLKLRALPPSGDATGPAVNNYRNFLRFLRRQFDSEGIGRIEEIYTALLEKVSLVQIDVWDPTNGPKIFDSLNSRQQPMTIGDLVRNEIFSKVSSRPANEVEQIDQQYWQPFYQKFKRDNQNLFDAYFFPFGLLVDHNLKKSEVYGRLRKEWQDQNKSTEQIIADLVEYQDAFIDLFTGSNDMQHEKDVARAFRRLWASERPGSTLPFLMKLSRETKIGNVAPSVCAECLAVIESFLVRRALCGHEPTGLHAVFKRLWTDVSGGGITADKVRAAISGHKTVVWPSDDDVKQAILTRPLFGSAIAKFFLTELDLSLGGDAPNGNPHIEHILPQKPDQSWKEVFSDTQIEKLKDLAANLLLLSSEMNSSLGNKSFVIKKDRYLNDSMYKSTRDLANSHGAWDEAAILQRGEAISKWAIERWKW